MARSKQTFERRERERAKKAKASAKREKRFSGSDENADDIETDASPPVDEGRVIAALGELNAAFERGSIKFDDFEVERDRLLAQLA